MLERWKKLSAGERLRAQVIMAGLLVGVYMLALYPISSGKFLESQKMLHRRKDRIEKRAKVEDLGKGGLNPQTIAKRIEEVERQLGELASSFNELDTGFTPVESSEVGQQLMLEISKLAERAGVELLSVARKGGSAKGGMTSATVDPTLGRPLLVVTANSQYAGLLDFLHGLKDLSFYTSVMNLKMYSRHLKDDRNRSASPAVSGELFVSLELSI